MSKKLLAPDPRLSWLEIEAARVRQVENPDPAEYDVPKPIFGPLPARYPLDVTSSTPTQQPGDSDDQRWQDDGGAQQ